MKPEAEIAKYFYDKVGMKFTDKMYLKQMSAAKALLKVGFTSEEIKKCIDYLFIHQPRDGFTSLGYVQYVINEILVKIEVQKIKEQFGKPQITKDAPQEVSEDNKRKYEDNKNINLKGMMKL